VGIELWTLKLQSRVLYLVDYDVNNFWYDKAPIFSTQKDRLHIVFQERNILSLIFIILDLGIRESSLKINPTFSVFGAKPALTTINL